MGTEDQGMTTKTMISGNEWTLIATLPTRVLLQAQGGPILIQLSDTLPPQSSSGFKVNMNDWADFVNIDDFGANLYAKSEGLSAIVYHVSA